MTIINAATFDANETENHSFGIVESGTVEVTLGSETRRLRAVRITPSYNGGRPELTAYGLGGRYLTSSKVWPAYVTQTTWASGRVTESADFGRDDRSGRFNKLNRVFFT